MTLAKLVETYINKPKYRKREIWQLSDFSNRCKPLEYLIKDAVYGFLPDRTRDTHECQIDDDILDKMVKRLSESVILKELRNCNHFDEIFTLVYTLKISGFGPLSVYDTALRFGAYLNFYPEIVYLHRGALEGAINWFGKIEFRRIVKYFCDIRLSLH